MKDTDINETRQDGDTLRIERHPSDRQRVSQDLFYALAEDLLQRLRNSEGGTIRASTLNVARQFLKDNGITISSITDAKQGLDMLDDMNLPFKGGKPVVLPFRGDQDGDVEVKEEEEEGKAG